MQQPCTCTCLTAAATVAAGDRRPAMGDVSRQSFDSVDIPGAHRVGLETPEAADCASAGWAVVCGSASFGGGNIVLTITTLTAWSLLALGGAGVAVGETVILMHPPLPLIGVSIWMQRGCQ